VTRKRSRLVRRGRSKKGQRWHLVGPLPYLAYPFHNQNVNSHPGNCIATSVELTNLMKEAVFNTVGPFIDSISLVTLRQEHATR